MEKVTLTRQEAAAYLSVSVQALDESRKRGKLPGILGVNIGKRIIYSKKVIDAWLEGRLDKETLGGIKPQYKIS
jgi:hypothetical protein